MTRRSRFDQIQVHVFQMLLFLLRLRSSAARNFHKQAATSDLPDCSPGGFKSASLCTSAAGDTPTSATRVPEVGSTGHAHCTCIALLLVHKHAAVSPFMSSCCGCDAERQPSDPKSAKMLITPTSTPGQDESLVGGTHPNQNVEVLGGVSHPPCFVPAVGWG